MMRWVVYLWLFVLVLQSIQMLRRSRPQAGSSRQRNLRTSRNTRLPAVASTHSYMLKSLAVCLDIGEQQQKRIPSRIPSQIQKLISCTKEKWKLCLNTNVTALKIRKSRRTFFPCQNTLFSLSAVLHSKIMYHIIAPTLLKVNATLLKFHTSYSSFDCIWESIAVVYPSLKVSALSPDKKETFTMYRRFDWRWVMLLRTIWHHKVLWVW